MNKSEVFILQKVSDDGLNSQIKDISSQNPQSSSVPDWTLHPDDNLKLFLQAWRRVYQEDLKSVVEVVDDCLMRSGEKVIRIIIGQIYHKDGEDTVDEKLEKYLSKHEGKVISGLMIEHQKSGLWQVIEVDAVMLWAGYYQTNSEKRARGRTRET